MQEEEGGWIRTSVRERKEERGNNEVHVQMGRKVILVAINDRNMKTCHVQGHMSYRMTDRQTDRQASTKGKRKRQLTYYTHTVWVKGNYF